MTLTDILRAHRDDLALVIGNGIHRYGGGGVNSWNALLVELAHRYGLAVDQVPQGASTTEFFDVLDLKGGGGSGRLAGQFCDLMADWRPLDHHRRIMAWAVRHGAPVLTTNFDAVLGDAAGATLMRPALRGFTDFYPWESRYALALHDDPCTGFGIWHINGMAKYARSIRLGLTHYMGSVQRTRQWLHGGEGRLFGAADPAHWAGRHGWLHLVFNKPLLIMGLGLGENEVFLRWLLIERARYFAKWPERRREAWYVYVPDAGDRTAAGRRFFLEGIGVRCVAMGDYAGIYEDKGWG